VVAIARGIAIVAEVADDEVAANKATLKLDLEGRIAQEALALAAAKEDDRGTLWRINDVGGDQGNALHRKDRNNPQGSETEHRETMLK
jgi:hypothetical protein